MRQSDSSKWPEPIQAMYDAWPFPHVTRPDMKKFTGNGYCGRSAANADCNGAGIKGRFRIGKVTAYPKAAACDFLATKFKAMEENDGEAA